MRVARVVDAPVIRDPAEQFLEICERNPPPFVRVLRNAECGKTDRDHDDIGLLLPLGEYHVAVVKCHDCPGRRAVVALALSVLTSGRKGET